MDHAPYLDRPLLPLAVALPRMLEKVGVALTTAGPVETVSMRSRYSVCHPRSGRATSQKCLFGRWLSHDCGRAAQCRGAAASSRLPCVRTRR